MTTGTGVVKKGDVQVTYRIYEYDMGTDGKKYDWMTDSGAESDELYDSIEDAETGVVMHLGGRIV